MNFTHVKDSFITLYCNQRLKWVLVPFLFRIATLLLFFLFFFTKWIVLFFFLFLFYFLSENCIFFSLAFQQTSWRWAHLLKIWYRQMHIRFYGTCQILLDHKQSIFQALSQVGFLKQNYSAAKRVQLSMAGHSSENCCTRSEGEPPTLILSLHRPAAEWGLPLAGNHCTIHQIDASCEWNLFISRKGFSIGFLKIHGISN